LPQGCTLRSSASKLGAAVDVIAAGVGFASGAGRRWFIDALPSETPLAELPPAWLVAIPGILAWIVEGALAWHTDGLKPPSIVSAATAAYRQEMDAVGQWFEECCERDSGARTPFKLLYNAYVEDLKADAFSKRAFAQELDRLGIHSHVVGGVKFRAGVRLRDDQQSRDDR
jgi:putative DNA primase/helicase